MAEVKKTVCASGCDYTTVNAALDWFKANASLGGADHYVLEIQDSRVYNESIDVSGFSGTGSITSYLKICSNQVGVANFPVISNNTSGHVIQIRETYTQIGPGLDIYLNNTTSSAEGIRVTSSGDYSLITHSVIRGNWNGQNSGGANDQDGVFFGSWSTSGAYMDHLVIYGFRRAAINFQISSGTASINANVDHCTLYNMSSPGEFHGGGVVYYTSSTGGTISAETFNTLSIDKAFTDIDCFSEEVYNGTHTWTGDYNISQDSSAEDRFGAVNNWGTVTPTDVEPSAGENAWFFDHDNFPMDPEFLAIAGENTYTVTQNGINRTGSEPDPRQDFSTDINGVTRSTPTIGAFEYAIPTTIKTVSESATGSDSIPSVSVSLSLADSGTGSESLPGTAVSAAVTDVSSGLDAALLAALVAIAETATASDSVLSPSVTLSLVEAGTGDDSIPALSVSLNLAEIGTASDSVTVLAEAIKLVSDAATASENLGVLVSLGLADTGTGSDSIPVISVTTSLAEVGSGLDSITLLTDILKQVAEIGSGLDALAISASLTIPEGVTATESIPITVTVPLADTGTAADAVTILQEALIVVSEVAQGLDTLGITATLSIQDTSAINDLAGVSVVLGLSDIATGSDLASVVTDTLKSVLDTGVGAESLGLNVALGVSETGLGIDSIPGVSVSLSLAELGTGTDTLSVIKSALKLVTDIATGSDSLISPQVLLSVPDSGGGTEGIAITVNATVADTATASDIVSVLIDVFRSVADLGTATENLGIAVNVSVPDTSTIQDSLTLQAVISAIETAGGTDTLIIERPGSGVAEIRFQLDQRIITFSLAQRAITFTLS